MSIEKQFFKVEKIGFFWTIAPQSTPITSADIRYIKQIRFLGSTNIPQKSVKNSNVNHPNAIKNSKTPVEYYPPPALSLYYLVNRD
jgi:hypothetical protein